jgi:RNA polymerase sigma factor (TIGR02999 family)
MDELRGMARALLAAEGTAQSLQPTALVLSALRRQAPGGTERRAEVDWDGVTWPNRRYFFAAAYAAMKRALIDHARVRKGKRKNLLRPARIEEIHIENLARTADEHPEQAEALAEALGRLAERHPDWAELVEHGYFAGYTVAEAARAMGISERSAGRMWLQARLLLHDEILRILNAQGDAQR